MTAKMITVDPVTDATLTSSTLPEDDHAAWAGGTTYSAAAKVIKAHRIWESVQAGNTGNDPETDDGTWWTNLGATNRWQVFDGIIQTQASRAESATWVVTPTTTTSSVSLFNVTGASVQITVTDPVEGLVYDETFELVDNTAVLDAYTYFFSPIISRDTLCVTSLPPYANAAISVTVNNAGSNAAVGQIAFGQPEIYGATIDQIPLSMDDYTRLNTDEFGRTTPVVRGYARTATPTIAVDTFRVTYLERRLADQRGIPCVWAFDTQDADNELAYLGFYKSFNFLYQYAGKTFLDLEIRSLV